MTKKRIINGFMLFVKDFRADQKKKGIIYYTIWKAINAADPIWKSMSSTEQNKYHNKALEYKEKLKNEKMSTSKGIASNVKKNTAMELEIAVIKKLVNSRVATDSLITMDVYIMDVNSYCRVKQNYMIGESTILRFNIKDGVKDTHHVMINPGRAPLKYFSKMKRGAKALGLNLPYESESCSDYTEILTNIIDFLELQDNEAELLPPIFVLPEKIEKVQNFLDGMCLKAGKVETLFRIYKLDFLFFNMMNALKTRPDMGFTEERLATISLEKDPFKCSYVTACKHHLEADLWNKCTLARARRTAYTLLDSCCAAMGTAPVPGRHRPHVNTMTHDNMQLSTSSWNQ